MMVRQDFKPTDQLPPRVFLEQIMDGLSRTYCFLWDNKNKDSTVSMTWEQVKRYYNKNNFRSSIRKLNNSGLINYEEDDEGVSIEMVGWDDLA